MFSNITLRNILYLICYNREERKNEMKKMNAAQLEKHERKIMSQANLWLQDYDVNKVCSFIWRRYDYLCESKNGTIYINGHDGMRAINDFS